MRTPSDAPRSRGPAQAADASGALTLTLQADKPVGQCNWLPVPQGAFYLVMRLYKPLPAALSGAWQPPAVQPAT